MEADQRSDQHDQRTQDMDQDERRVRALQALVRTSIDTDHWSSADSGRVLGAAFDDEVATTRH